jgi:hypothetical protein
MGVLLLLIASCGAADMPGRISLDGAWDFRLDPEMQGEKARWFADRDPWKDTIRVPGAWDAQGKGEKAERVFTNHVGQAWYRRTADIPAPWAGRRIWLELGGIHRYADIWVNGTHAARCVGYVSPHVVEITKLVRPGEPAGIAIRADSRQDWSIDALTGCLDIIDAMDVSWGGLWRPVSLFSTGEARIEDAWAVTRRDGDGWIAEVRVELAEPAAKIVVVSARIEGTPATGTALIEADAREARIPLRLHDVQTWTPRDPHLYAVRVELGGGSDAREFRLGLRDVDKRGNDLYLNGRRLFLRGYGDDCIFPRTIAPPADVEFHRQRFEKARAFGFNYVRHHSWWPPEEYLRAADEMGFLLEVELPIAYQPFWDRSTEGARKLYVEEWKKAIRRSRSHPSVIAYCVGNEIFGGVPLARELYRIAKEMDPARFVMESDGAPLPTKAVVDARPPTDIFSVQFDDWGKFGWRDGKYDVKEEVLAPVIIHEMANFGTFPDVGKIPLYRDGVRPFWLIAARELAEKKGLLAELPGWVSASERLQATAAKVSLEAARRSPAIDGYNFWLLCDYWTGSNGLVDPFYGDKAWPRAEEFRRFNAPTVLLLDHDRVSFRPGETARLAVRASRFEDPPSTGAVLRWVLHDGGTDVTGGKLDGIAVGEGLTSLGVLEIDFPEGGKPRKVRLDCTLEDPAGPAANSWDFWIFPVLREENFPARVATALTPEDLDRAAAGGTLVLLGARLGLPPTPLRYKPLWWLGDPKSDANMGTIWRKSRLLGDFPHDGWGDLQTYGLLQGAVSYDIDALPREVVPAVQAVDVFQAMRRRGALFEVGVGKGRVVVCGLKTDPELRRSDPAAALLFGEMLRGAGAGGPPAAATLSIEDARRLLFPKPFLELRPGEVRGARKILLNTMDPVEHETHVEGEARKGWLVRQTDGKAALEWETEPVPAGEGTVTFVWAGATGWVSEPKGKFVLSLNGRPLIEFDATLRPATWRSADGRASLEYEVRRVFPNRQDSAGVLRLSVPRDRLEPLRPARLRVEGSAAGSKRWCMLFE